MIIALSDLSPYGGYGESNSVKTKIKQKTDRKGQFFIKFKLF